MKSRASRNDKSRRPNSGFFAGVKLKKMLKRLSIQIRNHKSILSSDLFEDESRNLLFQFTEQTLKFPFFKNKAQQKLRVYELSHNQFSHVMTLKSAQFVRMLCEYLAVRDLRVSVQNDRILRVVPLKRQDSPHCELAIILESGLRVFLEFGKEVREKRNSIKSRKHDQFRVIRSAPLRKKPFEGFIDLQKVLDDETQSRIKSDQNASRNQSLPSPDNVQASWDFGRERLEFHFNLRLNGFVRISSIRFLPNHLIKLDRPTGDRSSALEVVNVRDLIMNYSQKSFSGGWQTPHGIVFNYEQKDSKQQIQPRERFAEVDGLGGLPGASKSNETSTSCRTFVIGPKEHEKNSRNPQKNENLNNLKSDQKENIQFLKNTDDGPVVDLNYSSNRVECLDGCVEQRGICGWSYFGSRNDPFALRVYHQFYQGNRRTEYSYNDLLAWRIHAPGFSQNSKMNQFFCRSPKIEFLHANKLISSYVKNNSEKLLSRLIPIIYNERTIKSNKNLISQSLMRLFPASSSQQFFISQSENNSIYIDLKEVKETDTQGNRLSNPSDRRADSGPERSREFQLDDKVNFGNGHRRVRIWAGRPASGSAGQGQVVMERPKDTGQALPRELEPRPAHILQNRQSFLEKKFATVTAAGTLLDEASLLVFILFRACSRKSAQNGSRVDRA